MIDIVIDRSLPRFIRNTIFWSELENRLNLGSTFKELN